MSRQKALNIVGATLALTFVLFSKPLTKKVTDGFTLHTIRSVFPSDSAKWATPPLIDYEAIDSLLNQKFHYLARGGQCYAFLSEDGRYVLKFFNQSLYKRKGLAFRDNDFRSYKIAHDKLNEETGLLFLHLAPGSDFSKKITLIDRSNIEHEIQLGSFEFVIQKRVGLPLPTFACLMDMQDESAAKRYIDMLFTLVRQRLQKGILDRDPNMVKNFGFLNGKAVELDIGRFSLGLTAEQFRLDLEHFQSRTGEFENHLIQYPNVRAHYLEQLASLENYYRDNMDSFPLVNQSK